MKGSKLANSTVRAAKAIASRQMSARHQRRAIAKLREKDQALQERRDEGR